MRSIYYLGLIALLVLTGYNSNAQKNITLLGTYPYSQFGVELNDVWGYVDDSGNEYAIVGVEDGVGIVDVTDPANPVEKHFLSGPQTLWRDLKVWKKHAYITNENSGGLMIIDLSKLPATDPPAVKHYTGGGLNTAHNLFIDEKGFAYIFGSNIDNGGALILDLADPKNPVQVGIVDNFYIHDGMARGDTLWAFAINDGFFAVIDVSDKANHKVLATQNTPNNFSHNGWISDDSKTLFTTDEVNGGYIASYDVSDLSNITEIDRVQSNPGSNSTPHNVHVIGDFLVTSYYKDGVVIHDATNPSNLVEVGNYDTSPLSGGGFKGAFGVYPWLPSGNLLVSDISGDLLILGATYERACYLSGKVTDQATGLQIPAVSVEITGTPQATLTDIQGEYATGLATAGIYSVSFSKTGYQTKTEQVNLSNGVTQILDVQLDSLRPFSLTGSILEKGMALAVPDAEVRVETVDTVYTATTDTNGKFTIPGLFDGTYDIYVGKWGYRGECMVAKKIDKVNNDIQIELSRGYYDDFNFDLGWQVTGDAATGAWERDVPRGTSSGGVDANPPFDVNQDCGELAWVTGNSGVTAGDDDVDDGTTTLTSPEFDLSSYENPHIRYHRWFFNAGGDDNPDDTLKIFIDNGTERKLVETVTANDPNGSSWVPRSIQVKDHITPSTAMKLIVETEDQVSNGHLLEAGFDAFEVVDVKPLTLTINVKDIGTGNPVKDAIVEVSAADSTYQFNTDSTGIVTITPLIEGVYDITAGKWGYKTACLTQLNVDSLNNDQVIELITGYYDDFSFDYGWTVSGDAETGIWERGEPIGTEDFSPGDANPEYDVQADCNDIAYVTGNGGGGVGDDDVDNGYTYLSSPELDLSGYSDPQVSFYRWFYDAGGSGADDTLRFSITNGTDTVLLAKVDENSGMSKWVKEKFRISDFISVTATMRLIVEASDLQGSGSLVEAGLDLFEVRDLKLVTLQGKIMDKSSIGIKDAMVRVSNTDTSYILQTDANGNFSAQVIEGYYEITAGKWGYVTSCTTMFSGNIINIELQEGYYDDFTFDFGWQVTGNAATGIWERGKPVGTMADADYVNPPADISNDCEGYAYVTGNGGGTAGNDDVDDGNTILTSPVFDLSGYQDPYLTYHHWFYNGSGTAPDDKLIVKLDNGSKRVEVAVFPTASSKSEWVVNEIRIADFLPVTSTMTFELETEDLQSSGHLVEAGLDGFMIRDSVKSDVDNGSGQRQFNELNIYPNPFTESLTIDYPGSLSNQVSIVVTDVAGRVVYEVFSNKSSGSNTIITQDLPAGLFFVNIMIDGKLTETKMVIKIIP